MEIETKNKILEIITNKGRYTGISAKKIMKKTNLSRTTITNYLTNMQSKGLVEFKYYGGPSKLYYTKEKEKEI